ncbi:MAG: formimidoylglutamase [Planctomycetes bacterium]|nr:formimidoylglutamase [Planctomycetota bacterium]
MSTAALYRPTTAGTWKGRMDDADDPDAFRWHQVIECLDLSGGSSILPVSPEAGFGLLGYCGDQGVERNLGRPGAARGPQSIRRELADLPCIFDRRTRLYDLGDVSAGRGEMQSGQQALTDLIDCALRMRLFPVIMGGGHELALGHYLGLHRWLGRSSSKRKPRLGIINFDAHLDLRPHERGANSGTMFSQIAEHCDRNGEKFSYCCVGVQTSANTVSLFRKADSLGVRYLMAKEMNDARMQDLQGFLLSFVEGIDHLYMTLCADVISSAFAPGVSAPQPFGLHPETLLRLIKPVLNTGKVLGFDIAEVAPRFDHDNRTAKLAAIILFAVVNTLSERIFGGPERKGGTWVEK